MATPSIHQSSVVNTADDIRIGQILRVLWHGKGWIILTGLLALMLGSYYAFNIATPLYTSNAVVVQETDEEPVVDFSGSLPGGFGGDQSGVNTEIEILRSRELLEKLVDQLELVKDPEFNEQLQPKPAISLGKILNWGLAALNQPIPEDLKLSDVQIRDAVVGLLREKLVITNIRDSSVYSIAITTENAIKSMTIANAHANLYISNQLNIKSESNLQATAWLTDRLAQLRLELQTAESSVKDFNARTDLINADTLAALNRQVKELRERLQAARDAKTEIDARIVKMEAAAIVNNAEEMAAIAQDRTLNVLFGEINTQTNAGRVAFDARFRQLIAQDKLETGRLKTQIAALELSIPQQELQIDEQSTDLITLQQLQREAEASRLLYEYFLGRLKETSVQSGIQNPETRVLSRAVEPLFPSAPRKPILIALSLLLGLATGSAFVLIREFSTNTFRSADELETRAGYPVLGKIPKIAAHHRSQLLQYLASQPTSNAAEAIRNMRTSVLLADMDVQPQVIMSTSSIYGEGKTTQSLSLTQNLAGLGKSVLLVEGDLRKRMFSNYFAPKKTGGLVALLEGSVPFKDAIIHETSLNADVLMSEEPTTSAADILSSQAFIDFLKKARKSYDYIVIDTPPVLEVPDARIIGRHVDTTMYTVRWDHTTHGQVQQGLKELSQVNVKIGGMVLAQIDTKRVKRYESANNQWV